MSRRPSSTSPSLAVVRRPLAILALRTLAHPRQSQERLGHCVTGLGQRQWGVVTVSQEYSYRPHTPSSSYFPDYSQPPAKPLPNLVMSGITSRTTRASTRQAKQPRPTPNPRETEDQRSEVFDEDEVDLDHMPEPPEDPAADPDGYARFRRNLARLS